jgi:hypothetical protein
MKKTVLLALITLSLFSCKKDDNNETTYSNAFPKTIVKDEVSNIGMVKTTESYTLDSGNKITSFTKKIVDNGTPTTDEAYTINYNANLITSIVVKSNSQSNKNYTYTFDYNGGVLQSITRNDNNLKINYDYVEGKVSTKTVVNGNDKRTFSYTYGANKIEMVSRQTGVSQNDRFTYTLNADGTIASFKKITYIGNVPDATTEGTCSYQYDNKPNIFQRDVFKYLAEIEIATNNNYYGDYYRDPLLRTVAHNVVAYTNNLYNNTHADYQDLENATRSFHYQWNNDNSPKSMEYKKNNNHKAKYTYNY